MTRGPRPSVIALAGPNGVGKSTVGADLLHGYDNSGTTGPRLIAEGRGSEPPSVRDRAIWTRISEEWTR